MPRSSIRPLLLSVTGSALLVVGFLLGRISKIPSPDSSALPLFSASAIHPATAPKPASVSSTSSSPAPSVVADSDLTTLISTARSPAAESTALSALRTLAANDPTRALSHAQSAPTPRQRDEFTRAVLHGWATIDPLAAARWTLDHVRLGERRQAAEALLEGAIANPDAAVDAAKFLCTSDPVLQSDHGNALVTAFARAGRFDLASQFAATAPGDFRAHWLSTTFLTWAQHQPQVAVAAAHDFSNPTVRSEALQGVITGWAASDPAALVAHAGKLPAGDIRATALREGLQQWVSLDPIAASSWMDRLDPSRDLDAGAAAVATTAVIAQKNPDVAASWAESIVDPELRANTLLDFIRLWAERDPIAARSYATNSPALRPETRASALASFEPHSTP